MISNKIYHNRTRLILLILILGILYRLILTSNGNFLFNMDNGRDMVDVREMVEVGKLRLTGPTSAIEGFYNGPAWYYLLAVPYVLSGGDPYASILMEILLWAIGGYFLLILVRSWGKLVIIPIGAIWIASNYVVLTNLYAFNPNPVILLTPVLVYLLYKFFTTEKFIYNILSWVLGGLFFNFEMNFGIFAPLIILVSTFMVNKKLLRQKTFWTGPILFIIILLPQIIFDLRHQFIMSKSLINFLSDGGKLTFDFAARLQAITLSFFNVFVPTLFNSKTASLLILGFLILFVLKRWRITILKNPLTIICLSIIFVPFLGYLFIPVSVNPWHLGAEAAASIILIGFLLKEIWDFNIFGKLISICFGVAIILFAASNILNFFVNDFRKTNMDPSLYKNEIAAVDYVYKYADGKNFKVYTYLPSVYDYPYQYLFWWYGKKKYGYIPGEYVYSPNKPKYIPSQDKFQGRLDNFSGLVFLIKEPDRIGYRSGWEGDFKDMEIISKEMVGPIEVEVRFEK